MLPDADSLACVRCLTQADGGGGSGWCRVSGQYTGNSATSGLGGEGNGVAANFGAGAKVVSVQLLVNSGVLVDRPRGRAG